MTWHELLPYVIFLVTFVASILSGMAGGGGGFIITPFYIAVGLTPQQVVNAFKNIKGLPAAGLSWKTAQLGPMTAATVPSGARAADRMSPGAGWNRSCSSTPVPGSMRTSGTEPSFGTRSRRPSGWTMSWDRPLNRSPNEAAPSSVSNR